MFLYDCLSSHPYLFIDLSVYLFIIFFPFQNPVRNLYDEEEDDEYDEDEDYLPEGIVTDLIYNLFSHSTQCKTTLSACKNLMTRALRSVAQSSQCGITSGSIAPQCCNIHHLWPTKCDLASSYWMCWSERKHHWTHSMTSFFGIYEKLALSRPMKQLLMLQATLEGKHGLKSLRLGKIWRTSSSTTRMCTAIARNWHLCASGVSPLP